MKLSTVGELEEMSWDWLFDIDGEGDFQFGWVDQIVCLLILLAHSYCPHKIIIKCTSVLSQDLCIWFKQINDE